MPPNASTSQRRTTTLWNADEPLAPTPVSRWRAWIWSGSAVLIVLLVTAASMTLLSEHRNTTRTTAAAAQ